MSFAQQKESDKYRYPWFRSRGCKLQLRRFMIRFFLGKICTELLLLCILVGTDCGKIGFVLLSFFSSLFLSNVKKQSCFKPLLLLQCSGVGRCKERADLPGAGLAAHRRERDHRCVLQLQRQRVCYCWKVRFNLGERNERNNPWAYFLLQRVFT